MKKSPHSFTEDFCAAKPCQNGGICDNNIDGTGYECVCEGAYQGKDCEISIYEEGKLSKLSIAKEVEDFYFRNKLSN